MHMSDALLSPAVGMTMWGLSTATLAWCARRLREDADDRRVPLMGVLGAFLFAAQMINFAIPGTGSSGHLGGGLLLAILLGPHAAFVVMASVLIVQALFFADGGLLALGSNVFNLGFFPAFVGLPLYRLLCGPAPSDSRAAVAAVVAAVISLQLGALCVVLQTVASGVSALPFETFLAFMLPIHLAIGIVEGVVTAAVVAFVWKARPDVLRHGAVGAGPVRGLAGAFLAATLVVGGIGAWYASQAPDGLEWSIARVAGEAELPAPATPLHARLERWQQEVSILPDYAFRADDVAAHDSRVQARVGTSAAGVVGGLATLGVASALGLLLAWRRRSRDAAR
jgi:cobalt/nickel transport system permease protein